jgi:hypothetical protein
MHAYVHCIAAHAAIQSSNAHAEGGDVRLGVQGETAGAVSEARQLAARCMQLGKELRGTDLLAERVHKLKRSVDQLEALADRVL